MVGGLTLYGVVHGGHKRDLFGRRAGEISVTPSDGLLRDIDALPSDAIVGVEHFQEWYRDGRIVPPDPSPASPVSTYRTSDDAYWQRLLDAASRRGLRVAFLDDLPTWEEYLRMVQEVQEDLEERDEICYLLGEGFYSSPEDESHAHQSLTDIARRIYRKETEAEYIHGMRREEKIAEHIAGQPLSVAIVGLCHGDCFVTGNDLQKRGVSLAAYHRESFSASDRRGDEVVQATLTRHGVPDRSMPAARESLVRRHAVLQHGRIFPDRAARFVGTWDLRIPDHGFFKLYVDQMNGETFTGSIEDTLGSARCEGVLRDGAVRFTKRYDPDAILASGWPVPIVYEGRRLLDGRYEGTYRGQNRGSAPFVMREQLTSAPGPRRR